MEFSKTKNIVSQNLHITILALPFKQNQVVLCMRAYRKSYIHIKCSRNERFHQWIVNRERALYKIKFCSKCSLLDSVILIPSVLSKDKRYIFIGFTSTKIEFLVISVIENIPAISNNKIGINIAKSDTSRTHASAYCRRQLAWAMGAWPHIDIFSPLLYAFSLCSLYRRKIHNDNAFKNCSEFDVQDI